MILIAPMFGRGLNQAWCRSRVLWGVVPLALLWGCTAKTPDQLRVGINAWPGYEFLYLAQEKGFYREEGLEVRLVEFSSLSDCRRAYERGQIAAMGTTLIELLQVRDQSRRMPQVVQVVDYSNGADVILARPGITNVAGLRGARVGLELASLGVYVLACGLELNGLKLDEVQLESMDQLSLAEAFRRGELDAVVTYPPTSIKLLRDTAAQTVFSTAEIPGEVVDVIAVEAELHQRRPATVAKLLRAYQRAVAYTQAHPGEAHRIMAAREGIAPEEFAAALSEGIVVLGAAEQNAYLQPGGKLEAVAATSDRILRQSGQIKGPDRRAQLVAPAVAPTRARP